MKTLNTRQLLAALFSIFALTAFSQVYNNNYQDLDFGGTGVTISYYPIGSDGTDEGDVILYENVAIIDGDTIDCYVAVSNVSGGTSITDVDMNSTSGSGFSLNEQRFFSPNVTFGSGTSSGPGGHILFTFQFIQAGSFSFNTSSNVASGTTVTLTNVKVNAYDIDGNSGSYSNQSCEFGGYDVSELASVSNLVATYDYATQLTSFESNTNQNTTNAQDDKNRVRVMYDSLSNFEIKIAGGGISYTFLDFGGGLSWTNTPQSNYAISGRVTNDKNGMSDSTVGGTNGRRIDGTNLYVNLINAGDSVVSSMELGNGGYFVLPAAPAGTYSICVTDAAQSIYSSLSSSDLPVGWVSCGEFLGIGAGTDGSADGILTSVVVDSTPVYNARLAYQAIPEAQTVGETISNPTWNQELVLGHNGTSIPWALDNGTSGLGAGDELWITTLPADGNKLYYNGSVITVGQDGVNAPSSSNPYVISNYDSSALSVLFQGMNSSSLAFDYTYVDAAGFEDPTAATYTLYWIDPLPVEFVHVGAELIDDKRVMIQWTTASESNNDRFEIQRKMGNQHEFEVIGVVQGAGNSENVNAYEFVDLNNNWNTDRSYYRVVQVDYNGSSTESDIVALSNAMMNEINVYPNPATHGVHVSIAAQVDYAVITVLNAQGQVVEELQATDSAYVNTMQYPNGFYYLQVNCDGKVTTKKIQIVN